MTLNYYNISSINFTHKISTTVGKYCKDNGKINKIGYVKQQLAHIHANL